MKCGKQVHRFPLLARNPVQRNHSLRDVRQIGPASECQISGICSACGDVLLSRIDEKIFKNPTQEQLRESLDIVFDRHVVQSHERVATPPDSPIPLLSNSIKLDTET